MHRRVLSARWSCVDDPLGGDVPEIPPDADEAFLGLLRFEIRANAFCHQMVRSIVGTLVDVGLRRIHAGEVRSILLARDRASAGQVAPPHGLILWDVGYPR